VPDDAQLDAELMKALRTHGHRVTGPRLTVYRHLRSQEGHFTPEQVHSDLVTRSPSLHHHLLCRSCEAIIDLEAPVSTAGARAAAAAAGFTVEHSELQLTGLCDACAAAGGGRA
jgi:Fe2+ or Zn2+ uptake regulation protein